MDALTASLPRPTWMSRSVVVRAVGTHGPRRRPHDAASGSVCREVSRSPDGHTGACHAIRRRAGWLHAAHLPRGIRREAPHHEMRRSRRNARAELDAARVRVPTASLRCRRETRCHAVEHAGGPNTTPRRSHPRETCRPSPGQRSRSWLSTRSPRSQNAPSATARRMPRSTRAPRPRSRTAGNANAGCRDRRMPPRLPEHPRPARLAARGHRQPGCPVGRRPTSSLPRPPERSAFPCTEG